MVTFNDSFPDIPGPQAQSIPLFQQLGILSIFDIFRLQLGKFVYDTLNNIGPKLIKLVYASDTHHYDTKFARARNFHVNHIRTMAYGKKALKNEGIKLWATIPTHIQDSKTRNTFKKNYKKFLANRHPLGIVLSA